MFWTFFNDVRVNDRKHDSKTLAIKAIMINKFIIIIIIINKKLMMTWATSKIEELSNSADESQVVWVTILLQFADKVESTRTSLTRCKCFAVNGKSA